MKYLLVGLVCAFLLVGCSEGNAQEAPDEPWIVTGIEFAVPVSDRVTLGVTYTAPHGRDGKWLYSIAPGAGFTESDPYTCWRQARIGEPIPDCLRSITGAPTP